MRYPAISQYLNIHIPKILKIREVYLQNFRHLANSGPLPESGRLNFLYNDNYACWVNYAPFFFRDIMDIYLKLIDRGFSEKQISPFIENKSRVVRYFPQILLPGAYLDQTTSQTAKMEFLEKFSETAEATIMDMGYEEPDYTLFYGMKPLSNHENIAVIQLLSALEEACEHVYFGEQQLGFPSFGIDTKILPDFYTLYQDFDLNLGAKVVWPRKRIKTITVYKDGPYRLNMDFYYAHIFNYKPFGEEELFGRPPPDRPPPSLLSMASIIIDNEKASTDEIERACEELKCVFSDSKERIIANRPNLHLEFCSTQSRVIKNLYELARIKWELPSDAKESIISNAIIKRLQKEYGFKYNMEIAVELMKRSIQWAKEISK